MSALMWTLSLALALPGGPRSVQGAVAACCLKEGMSAKDTERMLGTDFGIGNGMGSVVNYQEHGLTVCYDRNDRITAAYFVRVVESPNAIHYEPTWWFLRRGQPFFSLQPYQLPPKR